MELDAAPVDRALLHALGKQCAQLLHDGNFDALAKHFGYAVAFNRPLATAIEADLRIALTEAGASGLAASIDAQIGTTFFKPGQNLLAVVECSLPTSDGGVVLAELVVTHQDGRAWITLEEISGQRDGLTA
ncbi:hypothetical protein [Roseateles saccharophilus]|uniref:Uncharacterized protein n=1 Tax=Roseateles saccharophilus TaxID=304 RepID=A0A4V2VSV8_ROSSA|nr:hypothetical protein [Roseateles saccharophilus]MDG0832439.1 hypothetical protein [Roseateles saccharophilus]TCV03900.1 hypothetical protein EV671_1002162 [Roseateles saccharophilus]